MFQSLFYWITYSYITPDWPEDMKNELFQSLFYWITYSYYPGEGNDSTMLQKVSILILLDYLFL